MALAIFDLDNTLIAGDSDHAWGEFLVEREVVDTKTYREANDRFYADYEKGQLDIYSYLEFALKPLTQHSLETLHGWRTEFFNEKIVPIILPAGRAQIAMHKEKGDFIMIITATNSFVTSPIAEALGVDLLIASDPEMVDGKYTGRVAGIPSYQDGKVKRLEQWLSTNNHDLKGAYFYSDSHNDLPLMQLVDNPVAIDADATLVAYAKSKNWPIKSFR